MMEREPEPATRRYAAILSIRGSVACAVLTLLLVVAGPGHAHAEQRQIYFEYGLASATAGISTDGQRTLIKKFYLAALGPSDLKTEATSYVKECLKTATIAAVGAAQAAPSPEPSARMAAGWISFKASLSHCLTAKGFAATYITKFELALVQRDTWKDGIVLKYAADNETAKMYAQLYGKIAEGLPPGPARDITNVAYRFQTTVADATKVDIDVDLGNPVKEANTWAAKMGNDAANTVFKGVLPKAESAARKIVLEVVPNNAQAAQLVLSHSNAVVAIVPGLRDVHVPDPTNVVDDCVKYPLQHCPGVPKIPPKPLECSGAGCIKQFIPDNPFHL